MKSAVRSGLRANNQDAWASPVVWSAWAAATLLCLVQILRYGHNVPFAEDWNVVPVAFGHEPLSLSWLWSQNNEHRIPLARLILVGLFRLTHSFRAGMFVNCALMALLAAVMIRSAAAIRGKTTYSDAFFVFALLHLGHWENSGWGWQVSFTLATLFVCILLASIARSGQGAVSMRSALIGGFCLAALPAAGGTGLPFVPPVLVWVALAGLSPQARRSRPVLLGLAALSASLLFLYFLGYERPSWNPPSPGIAMTVRTTAGFLALSFGPAVRISWYAGAAIALLVFIGTFWMSIRSVVWRRPQADIRSAGLFLFGVGVLTLAAGVGYGRAGLVATAGMPARYALISVPMLCWAYFVWELYGTPIWRRGATTFLAILLFVLLPLNAQYGLEWADYYREGMNAFERDARVGMPLSVLCNRHQDFLMHWDGNALCEGMSTLQRERVGPFAKMASDPAWRELSLGVQRPLDSPLFAYALRFEIATATSRGNVIPLRLSWSGLGTPMAHQDFDLGASTPNEQKSATFWVNGMVSDYALESQDPLAAVTISRVVLLVPR